MIEGEIAAGNFNWSIAREDVHMNVEARLVDLIGDVGKKLHTGRSRNDQVATDIRLWLRGQIDLVKGQIQRLQSGILDLADAHADLIMPGFTHLQTAQPVTFGHHLMAWYEMLARDLSRFVDAQARMNQCPLGAAALAGTTFPIDRHFTARELGFDGPTRNSLDSVSDRDFAIEFVSAASLCAMHMTRMSEELIIWASAQFDFIELPDRFCTGSSIMPQKKNPDVPELVRGKSGRVYGHLMSLLTLMKSQPLAYNKDNQEDKEPLFDAIDTLLGCLMSFADRRLQSNPRRTPCAKRPSKASPPPPIWPTIWSVKDCPSVMLTKWSAKPSAWACQPAATKLNLIWRNYRPLTVASKPTCSRSISEGSVNARSFWGTAPAQVRKQIADAMAGLA